MINRINSYNNATNVCFGAYKPTLIKRINVSNFRDSQQKINSIKKVCEEIFSAIKVDKSGVETYSDEELFALLKKPNIKKCSFTEYQCWVMTNFLFSTGVRQRSLMNIKIKDIDFDNKKIISNNTTIDFRSLIIASGTSVNKLNLNNEDKLFKSSVS